MARVFKHICSAYGCNQTAKYRREIDGTLFKFCESHKYCLNHARAETIINMLKTSVMTTEDIISHFNYGICGFSESVARQTIVMLKGDNHVSVIDGCLYPFKDKDSCLFPGCTFKKMSKEYCLSHLSMPERIVIARLIKALSHKGLTAAIISENMEMSLGETTKVLCKLAKTGHVEIFKIGMINHYSSA